MAVRRRGGGARKGAGRKSTKRLDHDTFVKTLAKEGPPPVLVLAGEDAYLREDVIARLRAAGGDRVSITEHDGSDTHLAIATVLDEARTAPFLEPRRLVILRRAERHLQSADDAAALAGYIEKPAPWSCLCVVVGTLDERRSFAKAAIKAKVVVDASCPDAASAESWVAKTLDREHGKTLARDAARMLVDLTGPDLGRLAPAVAKLSLLAADRDTVGAEDVRALVGRERGEKPWELADGIVDGDLRKALRAMTTMLRDGLENPDGSRETNPTAIVLRLLPMIYRGVGESIRARIVMDAKRRGRSAPSAEAAIGKLAPWQRDRAMKRARGRSFSELAGAYDALLTAEWRLKGGDPATPPEVLFDLCVAACPPATRSSRTASGSASWPVSSIASPRQRRRP